MSLDKASSYTHKKRKGGKPKKTQTQLNARGGKFSFDEIHGFKLKEVDWVVPDLKVRKQKRKAFNGVRKSFLLEIGRTHEKELQDLGMTKKQIDLIKEGKVPVGFNVHHKLPIHGGGQNEFSNLILMPCKQHNDLHQIVLDPQVERMDAGASKKVMLPWSNDMVFVSPENKRGREKSDKKIQMTVCRKIGQIKTALR